MYVFSPYRLAVIHNNALQHKILQAALPSAQWCSTNQTESSLVSLQIHLCTLALHTGLQSSTTMHCSIRSGKQHSPLLSVALQTRLTAALCHCKDTYGHFLSIQACSHPTQMHCSTGFGKEHSPLLSGVLQTRLTAAWCHCKDTYGHFPLHRDLHCSPKVSKLVTYAEVPNVAADLQAQKHPSFERTDAWTATTP